MGENQKPTVGRIVHFYGHRAEKPLPAIVTAVSEDGETIGLCVFEGTHAAVRKRGAEAAADPEGGWAPGEWTWPPRG